MKEEKDMSDDAKASQSYLSTGLEFEPVALPRPRGDIGPFGTTVEEIKIRDIGNHISTKIEEAVASDDSFHYRDHRDAAAVFGHYVGSVQGLQLVDSKTSKDLDRLLTQFSRVEKTERRQFVKTKLRPFLNALRPGKRE
jgi:hypothetical protein